VLGLGFLTDRTAVGRIALANYDAAASIVQSRCDFDVESALLVVRSHPRGCRPALGVASDGLRSKPTIKNTAWASGGHLKYHLGAGYGLARLVLNVDCRLRGGARLNVVDGAFTLNRNDFEIAALRQDGRLWAASLLSSQRCGRQCQTEQNCKCWISQKAS
jgi:hypothetical protein